MPHPRPKLSRRIFRNGAIRLVADSVAGSGTTWLYLHGLASSRQGEKGNAFAEYAARTGRSLHRIDLRGHGESDGSLAVITLSDLCADVSSILDAIGPSVLIGSSLGGLVAAWTASRTPRQVKTLVLVAPALGIVPGLCAGDVPNAIGPDQSIELGPHVLDDATRFDETELATDLAMPTFVIHGALDEVVAATDVQHFFEAIPHGTKRLWMIEGGDHGLGDHLPEMLDQIARFVDSNSNPV